jgi:transcriptional regulator with XRE-family HTH domain
MAEFTLSTDPKSPAESTRSERKKLPEPLWRHLLGDHLRRLRHERGETLGETATRAGVSPQYLSEMERGRKEPSSEMIAAVAGALDTTLVDLTLDIAAGLIAAQEGSTTRLSVGQANFALAA